MSAGHRAALSAILIVLAIAPVAALANGAITIITVTRIGPRTTACGRR